MAPVADAVSLVDGHPDDPELLDGGEEVAASETLGRHEQEVDLAANGRVEPLAAFRRLERGVHVRGPDPACDQGVDLVLHQRDQGRDHEREPVEDDGRKLIDERLPAARRHHEEQIAAFEDRADRFFLRTPEGFEPELLA